MTKYDYDIGILGGGAAGLTVAAGAAKAGAKALIVEKEGRLGGDCLHYGCVPSKTLIRTARIRHLMKNASAFGLPETTTQIPDFKAIATRIRSVIETIQKHDSEERFCSLGVRVEFGDPRFSDDHAVTVNNRLYSARNWVIATGSSAAIPPIEGLNHTQYITNKEVFSLERLPSSMAIIGGGPIGVELAQAFTRLGTKVTIIEFLPRILSADDADLTGMVMDVLKYEDVDFFLNSSVQSVREVGSEKEVTFKTGEEIRRVKADMLLVATGRRVNLDGLGLDNIGVAFDRKGLTLDERLRTTQRHIYGAGDVTGTYQFTHAAGYEGGIALSNAIFRIPRKVHYAYLPWVTYTDPELASIGLNEQFAAKKGIKYSVWSEMFENNDRSVAENERLGRIKLILDEKEKPVGVQIFGPRAGDLLSEWVAVMAGNVKLSTLAGAVHPYPTLGEINKQVAGVFLSTKIFSEKVKTALKLFFGLKGRACG